MRPWLLLPNDALERSARGWRAGAASAWASLVPAAPATGVLRPTRRGRQAVLVRCLSALALAISPALCAGAAEPDYEALIALRSSSGFRAALEAADARLKVDADDPHAAGVRALVYANAVDYLGFLPADARRAKETAMATAQRLAPANPWTRAAFGLIHQADDAVGAERELEGCIDASPDFLECYNLYGDLLRKTERADQAGGIYERALQRWPTDGELLISHALNLQATGHTGQAVEVLERLVREQPDFARGHWHLAVLLYESGGDRASALREAQRALELDPLIWNGKVLLDLLDDARAAQHDGR